MLSGLTTRGRWGAPARYPGPGVAPVSGPIVTLAFILPLAGPVPTDLELDDPQSCQTSTPNVALQIGVVDQDDNAVDLSAATGMLFWLMAPDGTVRPVPAKFLSNGLDGEMQYVTDSLDLNQSGLWHIQAQITFGTQVLLSRLGKFSTTANIP